MVIAHKCSYIMQWMFMNVSIALLWSSSPPEQGRRGTWVRSVIQGDCFDWSRPKSFKYGTGPAQKRKIINMAKISTKKVKVEVKASQSFPFCCNFNSRKTKVWQALTWTFTFLVGTFTTFHELRYFLLQFRASIETLGLADSVLRKKSLQKWGVWKHINDTCHESTGWIIWLVPSRNILSMELVIHPV